MIRLFILVFLLYADMMALAQKDSILPKNNDAIKKTNPEPIRLTNSQQKWLNTNYKQVARLKKDSAAVVIRKNFTTIAEASLEYMISQAARLQQGDNQQQFALLKQMLDQLKQQKQSLLKNIQEKENQLAKEKDPEKGKAITNDILDLKKKLRETEDNIRRKEEAIRIVNGES